MNTSTAPAAYALAAGVIVLCILAVSRGGSHDDDDCAAARRLASGACCPPWHYASENEGCLLRPWNRPTLEDGVGNDVAALSVTVASDGRMALAWEQVSGPMQTTLRVAEERDEGGWQLVKPAATLPGHAEQSALAGGPDGVLTVAWRQVNNGGSKIMHAVRGQDGWKPSAEVAAKSPPPAAYLPTVVYAGSEAVVAWGQRVSEQVSATVALQGGRSQALSPPMFFANEVRVAGNASGDAIVSWYQSTGAELHVFAALRTAHGDWLPPRADEQLSPALRAPEGVRGRYLGGSRPAISSVGAAAVVWAQPDGSGDVRLMLATRLPGAAWQRPRDLHHTFSTGAGLVSHPSIAFTPSGDLFLAWRHVVGGEQAILLAHRLADGRWAAPGSQPVRLSAEGVEVAEPAMATGADGGVVVAWSERRNGEPWTVVARRSSSDAAGWEGQRWSAATPLSPAGADALRPQVALGGADDRALVAWIQRGRLLYATVD